MGEISLAYNGIENRINSDSNSNRPKSADILKHETLPEMDFVQDNTEYQWILDFGYRDSNNYHTSILSIPESYGSYDISYYNTLAKNIDANLAEADMESFRTEDIQSLLTTLPPICTDIFSQDSNDNGESFASLSTSTMQNIHHFENSMDSGESYEVENSNSTSMSICKTELLFSPIKDLSIPVTNYSMDSLDCDMLKNEEILTCQAYKDNYTIAFEEVEAANFDDSFYPYTGETDQENNLKGMLTKSNCDNFVTWSKLKNSCTNIKSNSGNNNDSGDNDKFKDVQCISKSLPNIRANCKNDWEHNNLRRVKIFNMEHQKSKSNFGTSLDIYSSSNLNMSNLSESDQPRLNLLRLYMKQKCIKYEDMSTSLDQTRTDNNDTNSISSRTDKIFENGKNTPKTNINDIKTYTDTKTNNNNESRYNYPNYLNKNGDSYKNRSIQTSTLSQTSSYDTSKIKVIHSSFLNKLKNESKSNTPIYVLYPNYVLPDLKFLDKQREFHYNFLPQNSFKNCKSTKEKVSESLFAKCKEFSHIKDWESLNFLLPPEYKNILTSALQCNNILSSEEGKIKSYENSSKASSGSISENSSRSSLSNGDIGDKMRSMLVYNYETKSNVDSAEVFYKSASKPNNLNYSDCKQKVPRKELNKNNHTVRNLCSEHQPFRGFLKDRHLSVRRQRISETDDEGVDAGTSSSSLDEHNEVIFSRTKHQDFYTEETNQLENFLNLNYLSSISNEDYVNLKPQVEVFLNLKMNEHLCNKERKYEYLSEAEDSGMQNNEEVVSPPNNSPNISAFLQLKHTKLKPVFERIGVNKALEIKLSKDGQTSKKEVDLKQKAQLIFDVTNAIDEILQTIANVQGQNIIKNMAVSTIILTKLCPAIYEILCDGLKSSIKTSFGITKSSVWHVVEYSSRQINFTKSLSDLVMKINSEEMLTENRQKFNSFIFGLINLQALDTWMNYLVLNQDLIENYYYEDSLVSLHCKNFKFIEEIFELLIFSLKQLSAFNFHCNIFFEHQFLENKIENHNQKYKTKPAYQNFENERNKLKLRTMSQVEINNLTSVDDCGGYVVNKRWSEVPFSKFTEAYNKLIKGNSSDNFFDSLEPFSQENNQEKIVDKKVINKRRFDKLENKWVTTNKLPTESPVNNKSRIPRLITSPIKTDQIHKEKLDVENKKAITSKTNTRSSRVDQLDNHVGQKNITRPSSLPYAPPSQKVQKNNKSLVPRRASSASVNRKPPQKVVRTLTHKISSDNGHLPFKKGEKLKVVLEVDKKWLLCSKGNQKGLVLRTAVINEVEQPYM